MVMNFRLEKSSWFMTNGLFAATVCPNEVVGAAPWWWLYAAEDQIAIWCQFDGIVQPAVASVSAAAPTERVSAVDIKAPWTMISETVRFVATMSPRSAWPRGPKAPRH